MPRILAALLLTMLWSSGHTFAACTGSSPTWTATADRASIASCVSSAVNGDTIRVNQGTITGWTTPITIAQKAITVMGGWTGSDFSGTSTATVNNGAFHITSNTTADVATRISNFTLNITANEVTTIQIDNSGGVGPKGWRVDNITRGNSTNNVVLFVGGHGSGTNGNVEGLIDNCHVVNGRVLVYGEPFDEGFGGKYRWAEATDFGTKKSVYIEDTTFEITSPSATGNVNSVDGNNGSRAVVRFNTFDCSRLEWHSLQAYATRAARMIEVYENVFDCHLAPGNPTYRYIFLRGGSMVVWNNLTDGNGGAAEFDIDNGRSHDLTAADINYGTPGDWGICNGSDYIDENTTSENGWLCRDQIGAGMDASLWSDYSTTGPAQAEEPAYFFGNDTTGVGQMPVTFNYTGANGLAETIQSNYHLKENRSWYQENASFTGSTGVGIGTLAARPSTCTTGVGYWATDAPQNWNKSNTGTNDGALYKCTATDTWTLYYVPYEYPHPLRGEADQTVEPSSTSARGLTQNRGAKWTAFSWFSILIIGTISLGLLGGFFYGNSNLRGNRNLGSLHRLQGH